MKGAPWGRNPAWARAGVQLGAAGAAAAGARGAEDQEPCAREERAQPGRGAAGGANFSHRGAESGGEGPGAEAAARALRGPAGETGAQDPNSIQVGQRRGGRRRRRAGGGRSPRLGRSRARVRTERAAAAAAAKRGWSRTEVAGGAGGRRGREGAAGAPGAASRSRAALCAGGCGDWMRQRPSPWAHWRCRRPLLAAARAEPARPAGLLCESARASRGGGQLGAGEVVTVLGTIPVSLFLSVSVAFSPLPTQVFSTLEKRDSWAPGFSLPSLCAPAS